MRDIKEPYATYKRGELPTFTAFGETTRLFSSTEFNGKNFMAIEGGVIICPSEPLTCAGVPNFYTRFIPNSRYDNNGCRA